MGLEFLSDSLIKGKQQVREGPLLSCLWTQWVSFLPINSVSQAKSSERKADSGNKKLISERPMTKGSGDQEGIKIRPRGALFHSWKAGEDMAIISSESFHRTDEEGRV